MREWIDRPMAEQAAALRAGTLTCEALMEATLARIEARRGLDAVTAVAGDAMEAARAAQAALTDGDEAGPLHGLPFAVKDLMDVAGLPGFCGSTAVDPTIAATDSAPVAALRRAGAIPVAKVATYEFALTGPAWDQPYPPAKNPWNVAHITGGSSSGSAAAVSAGMVRAALGTDTGGSVRSPASYCGIVGLKPTRGRVPDGGVYPLSRTLDTVGPLAACVSDAALMLDAISGEGMDPASRELGLSPEGLRIGFARHWAEDEAAHPALLPALDDAVGGLSRLGIGVDLIEMPDYALAEAAGSVIIQAEALEVHAERLASRYGDYGRDARINLVSGAALTAEDFAAARAHAARLARQVDAALDGFDAIVTATTLGPAPAFKAFENGAVWTPMRTFPFNVTGHPAISVPCGMADGLPLGLQIIGRHGAEARICRIADAFERATDHSVHRPPV
ncbi:amidase [Pelagovum pacificum]|uniref:Amidase n=1 Tax=Pelagovum pacificum TaxID=2588711 RepID=A0A5C5GE03_9RHOB|nr:amidase [Pelagovum pacificum]QQA43876.1 amidase [Pelagovum pacificum]TNY32992.1 amidase [Pelagovum pacificum]